MSFFYFSAYSAPLLFGFAQGWIYAVLLWVRARREERLSDLLLGWVLVACCFEIWEYLLGFGGIEVLWKQLEFFPRTLGFLLPPLCYFYLKSQFNADFRFRWSDLWSAVPFLVFVLYHVAVFAQGPDFVRRWESQYHYPAGIHHAEYFLGVAIHLIYFYRSLRLYREYRTWTQTQFSDPDAVSFRWFRNFLIAFFLKDLANLSMTVLDVAFELDYKQDWWDKLAGVGLIYYLSITGYGQPQPTRRLHFVAEELPVEPVQAGKTAGLTAEGQGLRARLLDLMETEKPYFDPDLSLPELAQRLGVVPALLSQVINTGLGKNFSDFVNGYRVEAFERAVRQPQNAHLSLLGIALDCGFNSKATFNRAIRKHTGRSPREVAGSALPEVSA